MDILSIMIFFGISIIVFFISLFVCFYGVIKNNES